MSSKRFPTNMVVPHGWLPGVEMRRIINHWTAGHYTPSETDLEHYHFVITGEGEIRRGLHSIADNAGSVAGKTSDDYAAHTRGCNSGSIGNSLACMAMAQERPLDLGPAPMKRIQWDRLVELTAAQARFYRIPVTPQTILSHAEVEATLGIKQRAKWDFTVLAFDLSIRGARAIGDRFRAQVAELLK